MRDDRDYKLELSGASASHGVTETSSRPFVGVQFECCNVYSRIYRNLDGSRYDGRCPRCARLVMFVVGQGGTDQRFFVVR
jgi:hypothetical protein